MGKNTDIDTLTDRLGTEFEHRKFTSDMAQVTEQQRWKLLDGIAKHAPGLMQKGAERVRQAPIQPIQTREREGRLSPSRTTTYHQEANFRSSHLENEIERVPLTQPSQRSFSSLFEVYTGNDKESQQNDYKRTSLKALLRQINS